MKKRMTLVALVAVLAVVLFLIPTLQKKRMESAIDDLSIAIESNPVVWTEVLRTAEQNDINENAVRELLKKSDTHVKKIQKSKVEDGIELLYKYGVFEKKGLLLSLNRVEVVPLEYDWGWQIEAVDERGPVYIYRISFYWD